MDATMDALGGLTDDDAARLLAEHGRNELPEPKRRSVFRRAARQLADSLSILLLIAGLVTLAVLGEVPEGAAILAILLVNVVIGVSQEARAEQAVRSLRTMTAPMAKVRRAGMVRRVPAAEVVPGDVVEVAAGDRVPADARVVEAVSLAVNESMLTGESRSAGKHPGGPVEGPLGDRDGELFSGTMVVRGSGVALVTATGSFTEMGRIASALHGHVKGPLEVELASVSKRMARLGVIVRKLSAIQALGSTTVIASDKTGTLTTGP
ncbi:HAD-IC family P-type ATPase [Nonomuraea sp. RK-328]|nr:HAD-IC family P-type ATPase [Nonomuraea sp. RK-328]